MGKQGHQADGSAFVVHPGALCLNDLRVVDHTSAIALSDKAWECINSGHQHLLRIIDSGRSVYGVNTGFGPLSSKTLGPDDYHTLQRRLLLSNAAGVGEALPTPIVRLIMILKLSTLSHGASGVNPALADALLTLLNKDIIPVIPAQGSVGASGDLAPLAHLGLALMGEGEVFYRGKRCPAAAALTQEGLSPYQPAAKEGLALVNGTQVSTAMALDAYFKLENALLFALTTASLSLEAGKGSMGVFDARLHHLRRQHGQQTVAAWMTQLLDQSAIQHTIKQEGPVRVQDPYCLRCVPQVMGAVLDQIAHVAGILEREANAVTDNPVLDLATGDVMYGGNFHAQPIGLCADIMAMCFSEIGAMSERRSAFLVDSHQSRLPAFLVDSQGLDSGFMVAQVTAAALASENKSLCFPASVDSIPTAANLEDYVSMATHAAYRLQRMATNTETILAIELLAAAQGLEFQRPYTSSPLLEELHAELRAQVPRWDEDRFFAPDIEKAIRIGRSFTSKLIDTRQFMLPSLGKV